MQSPERDAQNASQAELRLLPISYTFSVHPCPCQVFRHKCFFAVSVRFLHGPSGILVIPAGVTEIANSAFESCTDLTAVTFPAKLIRIGSYAFCGCTGLSGTVSLPKKLEKIGQYAFEKCTKISALDFSACTQPLSIESGAFLTCTGISETVSFPAKLKTIGEYAFKNCNKVDAFEFSHCTQLTSIESRAFGNCKADAIFTVKEGGNIKNLLLNSQSGIKASQITEVP